MIWLVTVLVSCVTVSAQICNVTFQDGKVLQPKPSVTEGATFLSHLHTDTQDQCQQGCCDSKRCDTVLFTGSKVGPKGNNCFYFDCLGHCLFRDATPEESNYSVATVSQPQAGQDLPDFSSFVSAKPKSADHADNVQKVNSTESDQAVDPPVAQKVATSAIDTKSNVTQPTENKVQPDSSASSEQQLSVNQSVDPAAKTADSSDKTPDAAVKTPDATVKPEVSATSKVAIAKNNTVDTKPVKNEAGQTEPTQASSPVDSKPVTVKDNDEKPETNNDAPAHEAAKPASLKPDDAAKAATEDEVVTPTEKQKPQLPNEVPVVVVNKVEVNEDVKVNATESKENEEQSKTGSKQEPAVVVVDKPAKENGNKSDETKPANNVSVEVDIHTVHTKESDTYTKKDVVFWVAVVGGSGLIVLGLIIVVRYYGNKRRRLYSSLTDDYLINGMYSI